MHVGQQRFSQFLAQPVAISGRGADDLLLQRVKRANAAHSFGREWAAVGLVQVEELAADVGQACELGHALREQGLVAGIVVDHEVAAPIGEKSARMFTGAADLIVEDDNGRPLVQIIGTVRPQIGAQGLARAGGASWRTGVSSACSTG